MANVCVAIIVLTTVINLGCAVFGAIDYFNTEKWIAEQTEYMKKMESKRA